MPGPRWRQRDRSWPRGGGGERAGAAPGPVRARRRNKVLVQSPVVSSPVSRLPTSGSIQRRWIRAAGAARDQGSAEQRWLPCGWGWHNVSCCPRSPRAVLSAARHLAITSPSPGLSPRATSSEDTSGMRWDRTGRDGMATRQLWAPSPRRGWPRCLAAVLMPIPGAGLFGGETRRDWEKHFTWGARCGKQPGPGLSSGFVWSKHPALLLAGALRGTGAAVGAASAGSALPCACQRCRGPV